MVVNQILQVPIGINNFLQTPVALSSLELLVLEIPQKGIFKSAIGVRKSKKALIVKWITPDGDLGYGECSCRPDPFYSHEFVDGAIEVIRSFIFPLLKKRSDYGRTIAEMKKVRGWHFTRAAVEFAMNDVIRRQTGSGLIEAYSEDLMQQVPVGISLGLFDSVKNLETAVHAAVKDGYKRLKFKISPGYDDPDILTALKSVEFENISFDANGSFTSEDFDLLSKYAEMGHIIEQPFAPGNSYLFRQYQGSYHPMRVCLDEEIESFGNLKSYKENMEEVNLKPGRVGGLYETLRMINYCRETDLSAWIGGMFETGIGRAQNLQVAALLSAARAHDQSPSSRYFAKDILLTPIEMKEGLIDRRYFDKIDIDEDAFEDMTIQKIILNK